MSSRIAAMRPESIRVRRGLAIPLDEIRLRTSRSSRPGGQHAQKTESRVEATFDVDASATLSDEQKARLRAKLDRSSARSLRTNEASGETELALERLATALRDGLRVDRPRRPTSPTRASEERRLDERARGRTKRLRKPPDDE